MAKHSDADLLDYARGALQILRRSVELYDRGEIIFYRVMAVELRLLLCDTTRRHDRLYDLSLLPRLFPTLELDSLDLSGRKMPLKEWLEQEIILPDGAKSSVRQLIRQVCEQDGGAHVDQRMRSGLPSEVDGALWMRKITEILLNEMAIQGLPG